MYNVGRSTTLKLSLEHNGTESPCKQISMGVNFHSKVPVAKATLSDADASLICRFKYSYLYY